MTIYHSSPAIDPAFVNREQIDSGNFGLRVSSWMNDASVWINNASREAIRKAYRMGNGRAATMPNGDTKMSERPVLVTTEFRGIFFGYAADTNGDNITLSRARNCIYWPSSQGGFAGLAAEGPAKGARIGSAVSSIDLRKVTSVIEVTPEAAKKWEAANVYRG